MNLRFAAIATIVLAGLALPAAGMGSASAATSPAQPATSNGIASAGWNLVPGAADALNLSSSYRNTNVHIMPSLQWYQQHEVGAASSPFDPATCVMGTDTSTGDAYLSADPTKTSYDSLDLSGFGLSTSPDGKNLTGQITVQSLTDGTGGKPALAGDGDNWYVAWQTAGTTDGSGFFLSASYPGTTVDPTSGLPVDFSYGTIGPGAAPGTPGNYTTVGTAAGSINTATNTITITAPLTDFGSLAVGQAIKSPNAETKALVGTPAGGVLTAIDSVSSHVGDYTVGQATPNCPAAASGGGGGATPAGTPPSVASAGTHNNLAYYGGPIVHSIHNYLIWWLPQAATTTGPDGNACPIPSTAAFNYEPPTPNNQYGPGDADYEGILQNYFHDLQGSSFYNLLSQYSDRSGGGIMNSESLGGTWSDPCGYTSTANPTVGPVPGGTTANPVYDLDLQNEVLRAIKINHWPEGLGNQYFVFLGFGVATCFNPNVNSPTGNACDISGAPPSFCAYHGDFVDPNNGNTVLYANMTDGGLQTAFSCYQAPIGSSASPAHTVSGQPVHDYVADAEVAITSHEQFETDTDAMVGTAATLAPPLGWYDSANGEIGDKCAYTYGTYNPNDGANITLQNGDRYIVQQEWSNWANGCSIGDVSVAPPSGPGATSVYGGASSAVPIVKGWNLIAIPASGISSSDALVGDMTRAGQLPAGSIKAVATFHNGVWANAVPGQNTIPISRNDGVYVYSAAGPTAISNKAPPLYWTPSHSGYTSAATITLNPGWNLVGASWPDAGVSTGSMFNQIEAENHACQGDAYTNAACNATVDAINTYGPTFDTSDNPAGQGAINWAPSPNDSAGNATWPQTYDNQIPFTSGIWVHDVQPVTWTPEGNQCQTISNGMCS